MENIFCSLENYHPQNPSQQGLLRWANALVDYSDLSSPSGLYLWGEAGIGKTHISIAVAKRFLIRGFEPVYIQAPAYGFPKSSLEVRQPNVVIMDDLNSGYGFMADLFLAATLAAHNRGGKVMVTSNKDYYILMDELSKKLGGGEAVRFVDRIRNIFKVLHIEGESHRQLTAWYQQVPL